MGRSPGFRRGLVWKPYPPAHAGGFYGEGLLWGHTSPERERWDSPHKPGARAMEFPFRRTPRPTACDGAPAALTSERRRRIKRRPYHVGRLTRTSLPGNGDPSRKTASTLAASATKSLSSEQTTIPACTGCLAWSRTKCRRLSVTSVRSCAAAKESTASSLSGSPAWPLS